MYCNKCGAEIPEDSMFCSSCGNECQMFTGARKIVLKCKNCNGTMEINEESQEVICPYCGVKEKILDSDTVAVEKIKSNTYKEIEFAKMKNAKEEQEQKEKKNEQTSYRKGALSKITLLAIFICFCTVLVSFKNKNILTALIAIVQAGLFAASWLMGMQIVKEKKRYMYVALAVLGFLFIIPCGMSNNGKKLEKLSWPDSGLATYLSDPNAEYGRVIINDDTSMYISIDQYSSDKYEKYILSCKERGFVENSEMSTCTYDAYNSEGYKVSLYYFDGSMNISLDAPKEMGDFDWPNSEIAKLIPKPESKIGKIEWEGDSGFVAYVGETTEEDFQEYIDQVWDAGFSVDYKKGDDYFWANNKKGYKVHVRYEGNNTMFIRLDEPK